MKDDVRLRQERLVFYREDMVEIDRIIKEYLETSSAKCVMLVDKDGHLVTKVGETESYDTDTISALVAGSFAATKEIARLLGEEEFSIMFHQGAKDNIQLSLVGTRTLLTTIFNDRTTVGAVRLYANEATARLARLFEEMSKRKISPEREQIVGDFREGAQEQLDDLFGAD